MADSDQAPATPHVWKFFRIGGLDQVSIETAADLLNLKHLDQKLWVALSCPVKGTELDEKTLALIDTDKDGRIRVPELLAAIDWAARHLKDPADLLKGRAAFSLDAINDGTPEGHAVLASAHEILRGLGKSAAAEITLADATDTAKLFASTQFNGDGVITADSAPDADTKQLVADIIATVGGVPDRGGAPGVNQKQVDAFFDAAAAFAAWNAAGRGSATLTFGAETAAASAAIQAVRAKIDDFFARGRLASFDARALGALNRQETEYLQLAAKDLSSSATEMSGFPLARIEAGRALPLLDGVNPAWSAALATLHRDAVLPHFGATRTTLTEAEWTALKTRVAPFETWQAAKAGAAVEKLGEQRIAAILASPGRAQLTALIGRDQALAAEFDTIASVERLIRYLRDFRTLVCNFVNFFDFYSPDRYATFQAGVLYLDSRSTELCVEVGAPSPLAASSNAYLAYLDLKRPGETKKIVAAFTQGDSDYLRVGRNGIFYDRRGRDWDACITSIVDNAISIRQAFWSPYKKVARFVEDQIAKFAAAKEKEADASLIAGVTSSTAAPVASKPASPAFDIAKFAGIFAAVGLALGTIGGALASVATGFMNLSWWQMPLAVAGALLVVSGPSMLLAALKLRQRTLGPILDAYGWAINGRVKINIPFGTKLTQRARLPANARRTLEDPYADKAAARRRRLLITLLILAVLGAVAIRWDHHRRGRYFWQPTPVATAATAATPAPEAVTPPTVPAATKQP